MRISLLQPYSAVEVLFWPPCFYWFLDPVLGATRHTWQELLWKKPPVRMSTCGRHRFRRNHPKREPRMWQGQVWEARPDREQRVARQSLERGMEAASGKKRTPQRRRHRGRGGNGRNPSPIQCAKHPIGHPQGGLLSIYFVFSNAGNASAAIFWWFLASAVVLRKVLPHPQGIRSPRVRWQICESNARFPDLALRRRCCLGW